MAGFYCVKKAKFVTEDEIDKEYCEEHCSMFDTCQATPNDEEAKDPAFPFSEDEDWDDDSDLEDDEDDDEDDDGH